MLTFKINEIPDGLSTEEVNLAEKSIDLGDQSLKSGIVRIEFDKQIHLIQAHLEIDVVLTLMCDRSLDEFEFPIETQYDVLFDELCEDKKVEETITQKPMDISSNKIDVTDEVRDSILLELPIKKLHPRFLDENGEPTDFVYEEKDDDLPDEEERIDPRWEALKKLSDN